MTQWVDYVPDFTFKKRWPIWLNWIQTIKKFLMFYKNNKDVFFLCVQNNVLYMKSNYWDSWQTTSAFMSWEPHEQYEKAKRWKMNH